MQPNPEKASAVDKICKVLIVENDRDIQQLLSDVFEYEGYRFTTVADGIAMRDALAQGDIDVVIIDVVLPGGENGFDLAKQATDLGHGVILVTGHGGHYDAVTKSGHRYLFKPFKMNSLFALVDQVLRETHVRCVTKNRLRLFPSDTGEAPAP